MPTYSLEELTERAGVTVRTVRYYIAEGLLPPPVGGCPRSAYTEWPQRPLPRRRPRLCRCSRGRRTHSDTRAGGPGLR